MDPLGGSFFVEAQTDRMEKQAYDYFRRVEEIGGVIPAIEKGFFQSEISDAAYRYQREIDLGVRRIVGVNAYAEKKPLMVPILEMDPKGYERQVNRLQESAVHAIMAALARPWTGSELRWRELKTPCRI